MRTIPNKYHGVAGHLKRVEGEFLYNIPFELGEGIYADLGTYKGRSSTLLAGGIQDAELFDSYVVTVDTFDARTMTSGKNRNTFSEAVSAWRERGLTHLIESCRMTTTEAFNWVKGENLTLRFLFIDADHSYAGVKEDFENWQTLVQPDGIIAFHDSDTAGVSKLLSEITGWKKEGQHLSLTWWKRI